MAFYKSFNSRPMTKRDHMKEGHWEEEGSRYSGASRRSAERFDSSEKKRNGAGEHNRTFQSGNRFGDQTRPGRSNNGDRFHSDRNSFSSRSSESRSFGDRKNDSFRSHDTRSSKPRTGFAPRPHAPAMEEKKSYLDWQQETPMNPAPMKDMEQDNLLSGRNPIREALKSGRDIEKLLVQRGELSGSAKEIIYMAREAHVPVQEVEKIRLDEIAPHHQGMVAFASAYAYSTVESMLEEAQEKNEAPFLILLDGVTDPHNLGAIIRSAECVGAHGVIVPERRSVGLTPAAVKASAGAIEHMKVARVTNLNRTIEMLKTQGVWTYAVTMDGQDYETVNFKGGVALVIGAEGEGISRLTLENCDCKVSLPMHGAIDSLNASVAAGVMMYRVLSSRKV